MRIVFIGMVQFSLRALERVVAAGGNVVGVCTLEASAANADHCDLAPFCRTHGIDFMHAADINSAATLGWIAAKEPAVIFCFGWSRLLQHRLLQMAPLGVVGFHPSALPANRGRHPLIWALALGLRETASTFFFMDEGADSGDILSQQRIPIEEGDDAATLYEKVTRQALQQIEAFMPQLAAGAYPRTPQDHSRANVWRKRSYADGQIDWRMSARSIHNLVRALARPYVGAHFMYKGTEVKTWRTQRADAVPPNVEPGKVLARSDRGALVACGEGGIWLLNTAPHFDPQVGEYL
jgi:methionyl-tRNA formyltransferase